VGFWKNRPTLTDSFWTAASPSAAS
jgi:hypothetical protein